MTLFQNGHKGLKGLEKSFKPSKPFWSTRDSECWCYSGEIWNI